MASNVGVFSTELNCATSAWISGILTSANPCGSILFGASSFVGLHQHVENVCECVYIYCVYIYMYKLQFFVFLMHPKTVSKTCICVYILHLGQNLGQAKK